MYEKLDVKKIEESFPVIISHYLNVYLKCDNKYNSKTLYYLIL